MNIGTHLTTLYATIGDFLGWAPSTIEGLFGWDLGIWGLATLFAVISIFASADELKKQHTLAKRIEYKSTCRWALGFIFFGFLTFPGIILGLTTALGLGLYWLGKTLCFATKEALTPLAESPKITRGERETHGAQLSIADKEGGELSTAD